MKKWARFNIRLFFLVSFFSVLCSRQNTTKWMFIKHSKPALPNHFQLEIQACWRSARIVEKFYNLAGSLGVWKSVKTKRKTKKKNFFSDKIILWIYDIKIKCRFTERFAERLIRSSDEKNKSWEVSARLRNEASAIMSEIPARLHDSLSVVARWRDSFNIFIFLKHKMRMSAGHNNLTVVTLLNPVHCLLLLRKLYFFYLWFVCKLYIVFKLSFLLIGMTSVFLILYKRRFRRVQSRWGNKSEARVVNYFFGLKIKIKIILNSGNFRVVKSQT